MNELRALADAGGTATGIDSATLGRLLLQRAGALSRGADPAPERRSPPSREG